MTFSPSSFATGNAPQGASYAAPLVGFQIGQSLASLPDQYMKGRENSRKIAMEDAFPKGVPTNPDGSVDVNAVVDKGAKIGGLPFVQGMLPFLQQMAIGKQAASALSETDPGSQPGGGAVPPQSSQPSPMRNNPSAAGPAHLGVQQPALSGNGSDVGDQGAPTLRSMATEYSGGREAPIGSLARQLKINPDAPLSAEQQTSVKNALSLAARPTGQNSSEDVVAQNGPSGASEAGTGAPNGQNTAPFAAGGASGSPAPSQGSGTGLPPGYDQATAQRLGQAAKSLRAKAVQFSAMKNPEMAAGFEKQADAYDARAKGIYDAIAKNAERTPDQKNLLDPAVEASKTRQEVVKADIEQSKKKYDGLQNLGQVGQIGNQKLDRIRSVMSDPGFMSGAGNSLALAYKQWNATLGGDPKAAQPMEEFNKTAQQLLSDDIKAMGASGAGPVRVAEVNIMKQATANLGISPATNRYLVEEAYRVHNDNIAVARMAQEYKAQHGYLDAGWDKVRDSYYQNHPLFTKQELADPRLVSPPYLPRDIASDPAKHKQWLHAQGIKPGDPIKTDDPNRPVVWAQ